MTCDTPHPSVREEGWSWFFARFRRHSAELARLATPVVVSRAGILTLALVDTVMLGPLGAEEVARYGLGTSAFVVLLVLCIGLLFGTVVETSHLRGEGRLTETGQVWRRVLPYAAILGAVGLCATQVSETYFLAVGQPDRLAAISADVTRIQGLGLIPMTLYVASNFYLEAMGKPLPGMIAVWAANIANIFLNLWLIDGGMGVSGADGAALATTICRTGMMVFVVGAVWYLGGRNDWGIRQRPAPGWLRGGAPIRRHGYASGAAYASESGAYHVMHIFAGWMSTEQLASFTVNMNLLAMTFMVSLGIANATAVRVGVAHGRRDWPDRTLAGWTGGFWVVAGLSPLAALLILAPGQTMSTLYRIDDPVLLSVMMPATVVVGFAIMLDGAQFTLANALRASNDAWVPTFLNFLGFIVVMIPAAYVVGVAMDGGAVGLYQAVLLASGVAAVILCARWIWICARAGTRTGDLR
ncbi:MAG: MATE family efflux transporter [Alphaproteobacteria bacterium]